MALSAKLMMRQGQSLVMTPQLLQAIKLLQFSNIELAGFIEEELERNPMLERIEEAGELLPISQATEPPAVETQTRRRLRGRQPLCGIVVTSRIEVTVKPAACSARSADSRPEPGPATSTSRVRMPCS